MKARLFRSKVAQHTIHREHTGKRLRLLRGHGPQMAQVALVANKHDDNVAVRMVPKLLRDERAGHEQITSESRMAKRL